VYVVVIGGGCWFAVVVVDVVDVVVVIGMMEHVLRGH